MRNLLKEEKGGLFKKGKLIFYGPVLTGFTALVAHLTVDCFGEIGKVYYFVGAMLILMSLCGLKYSDSGDPQMDKWVSRLDGMILLFVIVEFGMLFYAQTHIHRLRKSEAKYESEVITYNALVERESVRATEREKERTARQAEATKTAQAEARKRRTDLLIARETGHAPAATDDTPRQREQERLDGGFSYRAPAELTERLDEFQSRWESIIRLTSIVGCLLGGWLMIYIRNRSAAVNHQGLPLASNETGKSELTAPLSPSVAVSPALSSEAEMAKNVPAIEEICTSEPGTTENDSQERFQPVPPRTDDMMARTDGVLAIEGPRRQIVICNGKYKLVPRTDGGWQLRYAVPQDPRVKNICYIGAEVGRQLCAAQDEDRFEILRPVLAKKGIEQIGSNVADFAERRRAIS